MDKLWVHLRDYHKEYGGKVCACTRTYTYFLNVIFKANGSHHGIFMDRGHYTLCFFHPLPISPCPRPSRGLPSLPRVAPLSHPMNSALLSVAHPPLDVFLTSWDPRFSFEAHTNMIICIHIHIYAISSLDSAHERKHVSVFFD